MKFEEDEDLNSINKEKGKVICLDHKVILSDGIWAKFDIHKDI